MKLKPNSVATWAAVPLVALLVAACGDDSSSPPVDTDADSGTDTTAECGDGVVNGDEECDDGNTSNTDDCTNECKEAACGDGFTNGDEECDNGDDNGDDGNNCTRECTRNVCGDGHVGPGEACDDGNDDEDDGCTTACAPPSCGDGITQEEDGEECDDGNRNNRDGCTNACTLPECGDAIVQQGEDCDLGSANGRSGENCTATCENNVCGDGHVGADEACDGGDDCTEQCTLARCGDGEIQDGEECDDGNRVNDDDCTNACQNPRCGDGILNGDEQCDLGGAANGAQGATCTNDCSRNVCGDGHVGPGEQCDGTPNCTTDCRLEGCGDGEVAANEQCDDGNNINDDECTNACTLPTCGDAIVQEGEGCDLGQNVNGTTGSACTATCTPNVCGDGHVGPGEGCDEGDDNSDDADASCTTNCTVATCGDGIVQTGEDCDDGNTVNNDACTNACTAPTCGDGIQQAGEECDNGPDNSDTVRDACRTDCSDPGCGDGVIDSGSGEECDNGAANNGPGFTCSAVCTVTSCGNGVLDAGEECDDGNSFNNDSCLDNCTWNKCGDGAVYTVVTNNTNTNPIEECDDANTVQTDSCLNSCEYNTCADGFQLLAHSEPYDDPDGTGPMTASRGGDQAEYHCREIGDYVPPGADCDTVRTISGLVPGIQIDVEECDDGNTVNTDACIARNEDSDPLLECRNARCGDGLVQAGVEQCDEGSGPARLDNNDSCLDTCQYNSCGDGWRYQTRNDTSNPNALEECDDANANDNDYCLTSCDDNVCGDGVLNPGVEQCDDADGLIGDTCNADPASGDCRVYQGGIVECLGSNEPGCCGNGQLDPGEECDDGNDVDTDSCTSVCAWNTCGDGHPYTAVTMPANPNALHECDDANDNDRDSCLSSCRYNQCGDGVDLFVLTNQDGQGIGAPTEREACDDGNDIPTDECNACQLPTCGDGHVQESAGEECDLEGANGVEGSACTSMCKLNVCGDGFKGLGEGCDDGDANGTPESNCNSSCVLVTCGNGDDSDPGEECDDGNSNNTDGCTNSCLLPRCGDGIVTAFNYDGAGSAEECDDADLNNNNSCTNACRWNTCGDGVRYETADDESNPNPIEACDGGNLVAARNGGNTDDAWQDQGSAGICTDTCQIQCFGGVSGRSWARTWRSGSSCVFVAEPHGDGSPASYDPVHLNRDNAQQHCEGFGVGASLVKIGSSTENGIVADLVLAAAESANSNPNSVNELDAVEAAWIGLDDRSATTSTIDPPGHWFWLSDDTQLGSFSDWASGQPNDAGNGVANPGDEDCAVLALNYSSVLDDDDMYDFTYDEDDASSWFDVGCELPGSLPTGGDDFSSIVPVCEFPMP